MQMFFLRAKKLAIILSVPTWRRALMRHRVAAGAEHLNVLRGLTGVRMIVDVGANRGQFALVARYCFPDARIVAFEPLAGPAAAWHQLFAKDSRASIFNAALGPAVGEAVIHVSGHDDSSSLLPITDVQEGLFPGTGEVGTEPVSVTRLVECLPESAIEAPAILKMDVQGFELQALEGCDDVLDRFQWVYVECSFIELYEGQALADDVVAWLHQRNFALRGTYNLSYDTHHRPIQGDFIFAKRH